MNALILASTSAVRSRLLRDAGVAFEVVPPMVDEADVKASLLVERLGANAIADSLAEAKAVAVSAARPQALVIGCDQVLAFEGRVIEKSADLGEARKLLAELRGKAHALLTACVLAKGGEPVWRRLERCTLSMRPFSDAFLEDYLQAEGDTLLTSVGCYQLEGRGAQLFERVEGDYFSVLGLPLIPLLVALREDGILER